jgi:hypothetical protein
MDLQVQLGPTRLAGYKKPNIISANELKRHGYDDGNLTTDHNGLIYTCRGGFIDTAHVRDNADRTLYLAMRIARELPSGMTLELPEEGTLRRIVIKPLPPGFFNRYERWNIATALAAWSTYQLSVWHEIITWYGWESIRGISERLSAFSPEDLYSNTLGIRIASGILGNRENRSRDEYDQAMDAWFSESLRRLGAVSHDEGRRAMRAVDGLWWDSQRALMDFKLVTRRNLEVDSPLVPWLITDALSDGPIRTKLEQMCAGQPPPLPLEIPARIGGKRIEEIATVEFEFSGWIPARFPIPITKGQFLTQADFPAILADIRREGTQELGPCFDRKEPHRGAACD